MQFKGHFDNIYGKRVFLDLFDDFEFLTENGKMDHGKFSHYIKNIDIAFNVGYHDSLRQNLAN